MSVPVREASRDGRSDALELLRLRARCSFGSEGFRPEDFANKLRMSVSVMTPESLPDRFIPVIEGTAGAVWWLPGSDAWVDDWGGNALWGPSSGVAGVDGDGEADSTTHMRCALVATSFATVCARVEYGLTWKTGNESLPFSVPRSVRITVINCRHDELRSGRLAEFVRCLTSAEEMFPTTFEVLSITATLDSPSWLMRFSASDSGLSAL